MAVWASNLTHIYDAGITSIKLKAWAAAADDAYYLVKNITEASCKLTAYVSEDFRKRPQTAYSHMLTVTFTTTGTNLIKYLQDIKRVHANILLDNGTTISTGLISSASLDTAMGVEWEYTNDGEIDKHQLIKFTLMLGVTNAEAVLMLNGSVPADGTPNESDKAHQFGHTAVTDTKAAGIAKVELAATGGSYTDEFTTISNTKFTAKSVSDSTKDHRGRSTPIAVDVQMSVDCEQTDAAETGNATTINQRVNDVKITLNSGTVVTLGGGVGAKFDVISSDGGMDKRAVIPLSAAGTMPLATFTACWP